MKNILLITALIIITYNCKPPEIKPPEHLTLDEILPKHQWRKTEKAIYNTNNELEEYLFTFDDAEDCEKNSYCTYTGVSKRENYGVISNYNNCNSDYLHTSKYLIVDDTIIVESYNSVVYYKKNINYYDEKTYILDYDTTINDINKKIKETFTAFPKY